MDAPLHLMHQPQTGVDFAHGGSLFVRFIASNWCVVDAAFSWSERGHMHSV
jgi:hypothetical protein